MPRDQYALSSPRLSIAVILLTGATQLAVIAVDRWPWFAGLTELGAWLTVLISAAVVLAVNLVLLLVAWFRRGAHGDRRWLKLATWMLITLPALNAVYFIWFPSAERLVRAASQGNVAVVKRCLFWGIDPDATYINALGFGGRVKSERPLQGAAGHGHLEIAAMLINAGANVDANQSAALQAATNSGNRDVVRYLIESNAKVAGVIANALFREFGSHHRQQQALQTLLDLRPDAIDSPWLLIRAAHQNKLRIAEILASIDVNDRFGPIYELHRAIIRHQHERAIELYRDLGGSIQVPESDAKRMEALQFHRVSYPNRSNALDHTNGETLLAVAAKFGATAVVDALLKSGIPVDPPVDTERYTPRSPLSLAIEYDHPQVVNRLLNAGADPGRTNRTYGRPLITAIHFSSPAVAALLLDAGAPVDAPTSDLRDETPLMLAVRLDTLEFVQLLVEHGATLRIRDEKLLTVCDQAQWKPAVAEYMASLDCEG